MTTPGQPGPYPGQSGASWPGAAAAPGQPAATAYPAAPQPGVPPYGYNYGWNSPAYGYAPQSGPKASTPDRGTAILLLAGAALAVAGSFFSLTKAVDTTGSSSDAITYYDKPWSLTIQAPANSPSIPSELQFLGLPLALGAAAAVALGILLLVGFGARRGPVRAFGLTGAGLMFGAALMVMMVAVDDGQFDTSTHHTTFQAGFWLIVLSAIAALGAAIPGIVACFGSPSSDTGQSIATPVPAVAGYGMQPQAAPYIQPQQQPVPQPQAYAPPPTQTGYAPPAGWAQPGADAAPAPAPTPDPAQTPAPAPPATPEEPQQPTG